MILYPSNGYTHMDKNTMEEDEPKSISRKSLYHGTALRFLPTTYFSSEAVLLLICLTMSMLILPLILPPLPPPPYLLLLLPIAILGVLVLLAVAPSNIGEVSYACV